MALDSEYLRRWLIWFCRRRTACPRIIHTLFNLCSL